MGVVIHHALVVTTCGLDYIKEAHKRAKKWCYPGSVTRVSPRMCNDTYSFAVLPDGSKRGWEDSQRGEEGRERLKSWLFKDKDKGHYSWFEVGYGSDVDAPYLTEYYGRPF